MLILMSRRHLDTQTCRALRHHRVAEADHEDAVLEELLGHRDGFGGVADDDGADGGGGFEDLEAGGGELLSRICSDVAQLLDPLRLVHQRADRCVRARRDRHGQRVGEERRASALDDELDEVLGTRDKPARAAAERFAEGAGEDIDLADHVVVLVRAASGFAHDAVPVGIVDDEQGVVLIAECAEPGEVGDVAFHREHAVGDDPDLPGDVRVILGFFKRFTRGVHVGVLEDALLHALFDDGGESDGVDDAGVVELVGDDDVARFAAGGEEGLGRVPAGDEGVRGLGAHVLGDGLLEGEVRGECAADEADGRGARAVLAEGLDAGLDDIGVVGEPEVVVGAHADPLVLGAVVVDHGDGRAHRRVERLEVLELPG